MPRIAPAVDCVASLKLTLQSIAELKGRTLFVFDEDNLSDQVKGIGSLPAIGIVYEGMRATPEQGTGRMGMSAEMVFSLVLINRSNDIVSSDQTKTETLVILDAIRSKLLGTRSPTGHFWRFVVEAAASQSKGVVFWVTRWSTPVQLQARV
jgi:hypothetical protein